MLLCFDMLQFSIAAAGLALSASVWSSDGLWSSVMIFSDCRRLSVCLCCITSILPRFRAFLPLVGCCPFSTLKALFVAFWASSVPVTFKHTMDGSRLSSRKASILPVFGFCGRLWACCPSVFLACLFGAFWAFCVPFVMVLISAAILAEKTPCPWRAGVRSPHGVKTAISGGWSYMVLKCSCSVVMASANRSGVPPKISACGLLAVQVSRIASALHSAVIISSCVLLFIVCRPFWVWFCRRSRCPGSAACGLCSCFRLWLSLNCINYRLLALFAVIIQYSREKLVIIQQFKHMIIYLTFCYVVG